MVVKPNKGEIRTPLLAVHFEPVLLAYGLIAGALAARILSFLAVSDNCWIIET